MRSLAATMVCLTASASAQVNSRFSDAHAEAMSAFSDCKSAWFRKAKLSALEIIEDRGTRMALALDPMSEAHEEQMKMMDEVTAALQACSAIAYPSN